MSESVLFEVDGKEYCNEEAALSILLRDEVLFCNERDVVFRGEPSGCTTVLYVNCNDVFAWACADAEDLPNDEIGNLYKMHIADPKWGSIKWCCHRRNEQPQKPVADDMKLDGSWDESMDDLKENAYDNAHRCIGDAQANKSVDTDSED